MNKRGLSDVITNVLIILLVLIAIGIIASFVIPLLKNTSTQITDAQTCLQVKVDVAKCNVIVNGSTYDVVVNVHRDAGASSAQFKDVKLILENADGTTQAVSLSDSNRAGLVELATVSQRFANTGNIKSASVAVTLNESQDSCPATAKVACSIA